MGANTKQIRNRIKSVDSTLHLTKAMGLVASSKIRRAMEAMSNGRKYEDAVREAIAPILNSPEAKKSPYMRKGENDRLCLIVIAGDRGLAGGYNANIFRALREYADYDIIPIGKKACERFKGKLLQVESFDYSQAKEIADNICKDFSEKKYGKVAILCTKYVSMLSQEAYLRQIFPLVPTEEEKSHSIIFEPDEMTVLNTMIPSYVAGILMSAVRESFACELAARRSAMDSAGKNAQEMIDTLTLEYNRARQSAITQEITEIVAGGAAT